MTIEEAITKLKEDYILRSMLKKKNLNVQDELEDEIEDLEQAVITSKIIPVLENYAKKLLQDLECAVCLGVLKDSNGDVRVDNEYVDSIPVPFHEDTAETVGVSEDEVVSVGEDNPGEPLSEAEPILITRNNVNDSQNYNLRIAIDGEVYQEKNVVKTFVKVIQHIGLDKVAKVGIICSGYNLVDTRKRTDGTHKWQHEVEGKWIYTNLSTPTKCSHLFQIAEYLHKDIKIEVM